MGKKGKNPSRLTDEVREIVDGIYTACVAVMDRVLIKYRTPEDYVKKSLLKVLRTDKNFAIGRLIISSPNEPLTPYEINRNLNQHFRPGEDDERGFLHGRDLRKVAKFLESAGLFDNIRGKKEIKSKFGIRHLERRQGKRTGGSPSVYRITNAFETVKRVMEKQEARDLLRQKLLKLPVTLKFERFILKAAYILAKSDEEYTEKVLRLVAPSEDLQLLAQSQPSRHSIFQSLNSISEEELDTYIDQRAKSTVETRPYDLYFIFLLVEYGRE